MRDAFIRHVMGAAVESTPGGLLTPVEVVFTYRAANPYAVELAFRTRPTQWVTWRFARDLLAAGMAATSGDGDVRITPDNDNDARVWICVTSPAGRADFAFARAALEHALDDTEALVPEGTEAELIDWDREIAELGEVA